MRFVLSFSLSGHGPNRKRSKKYHASMIAYVTFVLTYECTLYLERYHQSRFFALCYHQH